MSSEGEGEGKVVGTHRSMALLKIARCSTNSGCTAEVYKCRGCGEHAIYCRCGADYEDNCTCKPECLWCGKFVSDQHLKLRYGISRNDPARFREAIYCSTKCALEDMWFAKAKPNTPLHYVYQVVLVECHGFEGTSVLGTYDNFDAARLHAEWELSERISGFVKEVPVLEGDKAKDISFMDGYDDTREGDDSEPLYFVSYSPSREYWRAKLASDFISVQAVRIYGKFVKDLVDGEVQRLSEAKRLGDMLKGGLGN